jgi:hypothetical protein
MTYFFDRSMRKKIPQAFGLLGLDAIAHDDYFDQATPDDVWLTVARQQGWAIITKDDRIRFNEAERAALIAYAVGCFIVSRRNAPRWQLAQSLLRAWDDITRIANTAPRPFLYAVYADGRLREWPLS